MFLKYVVLSTLVLTSSLSMAADSAKDLMLKVENKKAPKNTEQEAEMVLISKSGKEKKRLLKIWGEKKGDDSKSLIKFKKPRRMKNTGFLTVKENNKTQQWLYLPNVSKKPRRIAEGDKGGSFLGSQFFYIDLEPTKTEDYNYKTLRKEKIDGVEYTVIESTPKDKDHVYSKAIVWIDAKNLIRKKAEMYQKSKLLKIIEAVKIEKVQGFDTVMLTRVRNLKNKKSSEMRVKSVKYDTSISKSQFSLNSLTKSL